VIAARPCTTTVESGKFSIAEGVLYVHLVRVDAAPYSAATMSYPGVKDHSRRRLEQPYDAKASLAVDRRWAYLTDNYAARSCGEGRPAYGVCEKSHGD
jgi:hypothetical protein